MSEVNKITENLAKHNIRIVDYDEDENSIKNFLMKMRGNQPRGHIGPSSWWNPSGELTIYVPKAARETPEAFKEFITEEVKHIDQIRETPFSTALSGAYETLKEKTSTIPSRLWSHVPEFVSEEENKKYLDELYDVGMSGGDLDQIESPYWKQRSGIGQVLKDLHYDRYRDPESVEGIHLNKERYEPVLEKYGFTQEYNMGGQIENLTEQEQTLELGLRDFTDIIFDPSDPVDYVSMAAGPIGKGIGSVRKVQKLLKKLEKIKEQRRRYQAQLERGMAERKVGLESRFDADRIAGEKLINSAQRNLAKINRQEADITAKLPKGQMEMDFNKGGVVSLMPLRY